MFYLFNFIFKSFIYFSENFCIMNTALQIEAQHPISSQSVLENLANSEDFRARLTFEMDDQNVIQNENRNINYIPFIPGLSPNHPVRVFQNDKITWIQDDIILKSRFLFNFQGKSIKIKSVRIISPNPDRTSHSVVRVEILNDELNNDFSKKALSYILKRHNTENSLLSLSTSRDLGVQKNFTIPFDSIFSEVQTAIMQIDQLLTEESTIDPSIEMAANQLQELHNEVNEAASKIMTALQVRDNLQQEIKQQSTELAATASEIEQIIVDPNRSPTVPDTKNDVAFMFSLIPLVVAITGYILKKD